MSTINGVTRRGFTDHEMLDSTALVHMNGRVFEPTIGRFVSADPHIDYPLRTQGRNRFSYVGNMTLSRRDLTGFCSGDPEIIGENGLGEVSSCAPRSSGTASPYDPSWIDSYLAPEDAAQRWQRSWDEIQDQITSSIAASLQDAGAFANSIQEEIQQTATAVEDVVDQVLDTVGEGNLAENNVQKEFQDEGCHWIQENVWGAIGIELLTGATAGGVMVADEVLREVGQNAIKHMGILGVGEIGEAAGAGGFAGGTLGAEASLALVAPTVAWIWVCSSP